MSNEREATALAALRDQEIEIPSWGFGASGTRFGKLPVPGH
jgi:L-rhamnose isomerase